MAVGAAFLSILTGNGSFILGRETWAGFSDLWFGSSDRSKVFLANGLVVLYSVSHFFPGSMRFLLASAAEDFFNRKLIAVVLGKAMMKTCQWIVIAVSFVALCTVLPTGVGSEERAIELYVTDALTIPSKSVSLQARLTEHSPRRRTGPTRRARGIFSSRADPW